MTTFLSREHHSYSLTNAGSKKKIKNFSYSPSDRIGKGYSSVVYRGKNDNTDQIVAIKAIDMKGVKDAVSRQMLDCQIQALTKLKHPNILRCHEVVRQTSHCYIITEFCSQGDLSSYLKKKKRLSESEAISIVKDIVNGFLEIGEKKFLHRDLKLANILMNDKGVAKIADFGFAKKSFYQSEKEKYNVGSPLYMSPEALKKNIYSVKNDIWSIGIMVYELLHGETPWDCKTENQLIDKMTRVPVKFRSSINISQNLKDFIKKCLEVSEAKRMSLKELRDWSEGISHPRSHSVAEKHVPALEKRYSANENVPQFSKKTSETESYASKPLGDVTNRQSVGVEKARSFSNVLSKMNNHRSAMDKENFNSTKNTQQLSKAIIDKNNTLVLAQINKFRLMFKIYQKLKKMNTDEKTLQSVLAAQILRRLEYVSDIILKGQGDSGKKKAEKLGIKEVESYTREESNVGIKKYVAVIKEYQRKYKTEVETPSTSTFMSLNTALKAFLTVDKVNKDLSKEESLLYNWAYEVLVMSPTIKKDELDSIIDGKRIQSAEVLAAKIQEVQ